MIAIFARVPGEHMPHVERLAQAPTAGGGVRFRFRARHDALSYQVVFIGYVMATAAVNYYILRH